MAMKRIDDLTEATTVTLTDVVEIEAAAGSRRAKKVNMLAPTIESVSANHTIAGREDSRVILMTTGATDRTCALPDSSTDDVEAGDEFKLHKVDAGAGTASLTRQGTDTINGETSVPLYSQGDHARVMYLGGGSYTVVDLKSHGSNSDGEYARFSSGMQMCWIFKTQSLVITPGLDVNFTMPAAFIAIPSAAGSAFPATVWTGFHPVAVEANSVSNVRIRMVNTNSVQDVRYQITVMGRWRT